MSETKMERNLVLKKQFFYLGNSKLEFGACLAFGYWDLELKRI
jgi:hypothetical protein